LFVAGYWMGFVLIADALEEDGRALALFTFAAAFFPLTLNFNGQLVKDVSMAISLLLATGIAAGLMRGSIQRRALALPLMWLFLIMGAFMRANALFALPPLLDLAAVATSARWAALGWMKRIIIVSVVAIAMAPAHILADRNLFRVVDIKPLSQLQVFDIGGISYFSGIDRYNGLFGPQFVEKNRTCYTPKAWDVYGWGGCEEVYENLKPEFGWPLSQRWLEAIAAEPFSYVAHRIAHVNRYLQFLCRDCKEMVYTGAQSTNQKEFTFEPGPLYQAIDTASQALNDSFLGRPYVFLLIALAWAWAALAIPDATTRRVILTLTLSGALYALGFAAIGIASDYRYIYWTMICATLATPAVVMRVLARSDRPLAYRLIPLLMILAVILAREAVVRFVL
jgi:hypothetical protein